MPHHSLSERSLALIGALNRRGIHGPRCKILLKRYSQRQLALQIDYYDHEVVYHAKLPEWAATPWLAYRIRHDKPAPRLFRLSSQSLSHQLGLMPGRGVRSTGPSSAAGKLAGRQTTLAAKNS